MMMPLLCRERNMAEDNGGTIERLLYVETPCRTFVHLYLKPPGNFEKLLLSDIQKCETPYGEPACRCGYYTQLVWEGHN